jgi:transcriptional regulator with XRE-family HTH domain
MESKTERLARIVVGLRGSKSQRQFARELGVSQSSVRFWESHLAWPETENLEKLALLKGWNLSQLQTYLVEGELPEEEPLEQILKMVRSLPLEAVARVATVAVEILAEKSLKTQNYIKSIHDAVEHKAG